MNDLCPEEIVRLIEEHGAEGRQRLFDADIPGKIEKLGIALQRAKSPLVRQVLCQLFASLADPRALTFLVEALDDPANLVVAAAEDAIGNCSAGQDVPTTLRARLGSRLLQLLMDAAAPQAAKSGAIYALGLMRYREATPRLIAALEDHAPIIRWCAAEALSHIGDRAALEPLESRYRREADPRVRRYLRTALKSLAAG